MKKQSRWNGQLPRYDDATYKLIGRKYREYRGWHQGARLKGY